MSHSTISSDTSAWLAQDHPDPLSRTNLSQSRREKYERMTALILASPYGPHAPPLPFRPSYNLSQLSLLPTSVSPARSVAEMWDRASQKEHVSRIINRPTTRFNRQREVKVEEEEGEKVGEVVWGEESSWDDEGTRMSGEENLREVGIVVEKKEIGWEEQMVVEADKFRCFESSRLRWSWRMMGEEEKKKEEKTEWEVEIYEEEEAVVEKREKSEKNIVEGGMSGEWL